MVRYQYLSLLAAAREIAAIPSEEADYMEAKTICRKYGIYLESLTSDEISILNSLIAEFTN